jgi:hypothetical protein
VTTLEAFLTGLKARGVELTDRGDQLGYRAPNGVLTPDDRQALKENKAEVLALLKTPPRAARTAGTQTFRRDGPHGQPAGPTSTAPGREIVPQADARTTSHKSHKSTKTVPATDSSTRVMTTGAQERRRPTTGRPLDGLSVAINGKVYPYTVWGGETLEADLLGFDTETALIVENEVPPLALASVSTGSRHCLVHPDRLGEFLLLHHDRRFVLFNCAFDYWVVAGHLAGRGESTALGAWQRVVDEGRMRDAMLLDELIRLARTDARPRPRGLAEVAREYAGLELDKQDPYRTRYAEIIGRDWAAVDRGFFDYAVKDPIATLAAYQAMYPESLELQAHGGQRP